MAEFRMLDEGLLIGPQPDAQDLAKAKLQGVRTVIDMRMPTEPDTANAHLVKNSGLAYVNIPVNKSALDKRQIDELEESLKGNEGPFLLHCATGARAALLLALSRAKQHEWTAERTFREAEAMGFDLRNSAEFATFVRQAREK